jgi:hypothetical protein
MALIFTCSSKKTDSTNNLSPIARKHNDFKQITLLKGARKVPHQRQQYPLRELKHPQRL